MIWVAQLLGGAVRLGHVCRLVADKEPSRGFTEGRVQARGVRMV